MMYKCVIAWGEQINKQTFDELEDFLGSKVPIKTEEVEEDNLITLYDYDKHNIDIDSFYKKFPEIKLSIYGVSEKIPVYTVYVKDNTGKIATIGTTYSDLSKCIESLNKRLENDLKDNTPQKQTNLYGIWRTEIFDGALSNITDFPDFWKKEDHSQDVFK